MKFAARLLVLLAVICLSVRVPAATVLSTPQLQASSCTNPACEILDGILTALGMGSQFEACIGDTSQAFQDFATAAQYFEQGKEQQGVWVLAEAMAEFSTSMSACKVEGVADWIMKLAQKIGHTDVEWIHDAAVVLVNGVNIADDLSQIAKDFSQKNYGQMGTDLGALVLDISQSTPCANGACDLLTGMLKIAGVLVNDLGACKDNLGKAWSTIQSGVAAFENKQYETAVSDLASGLDQIAVAAGPCNIEGLATLIEDEAKTLGVANVQWIGQSVSIVVGSLDIYSDLYSAVEDWNSGNFNGFGADIAALLGTLETSACVATDPACILLDGFLQTLKVVAQDMAGTCRADLSQAVASAKTAAANWEAKKYADAVTSMAVALDDIALGLGQCNLPQLADIVAKQAQKLHIAVPQDLGQKVQILVNDVDVGTAVFAVVEDLSQDNLPKMAVDLANLVSALATVGCGNSKGCQAVSGLLQSLEILSADLSGPCAAGIDAGFTGMENGIQEFSQGSYKQGVADFATGLDNVAKSIQLCNLNALATLLEAEAELIAGADISVIGKDVQILINGAQVADDFYTIATALEKGDMVAFGRAVGDLLSKLRALSCKSTVCTLLDGILQVLNIAAQDWGKCSSDLDAAEAKFSVAFSQMKSSQYVQALASMGDAFEQLADGVSDCDVQDLGTILENEAQLLHLGNVKIIGDAVAILSNSANLYKVFYQGAEDFASGDFRNAGIQLGQLLLDIAAMQNSTGCSSPFCIIVQGAMDALNVENSLKQCGSDLSSSWTDLEGAAKALFGPDASLRTAVHDLANGLDELSKGVSDCHVEQVAQIIEEVASKLGAGYIGWLEEAVKIVVDGSEIYDEVYSAVVAWDTRDFFGFGYEIMKLAIALS
eukprot:ANDGO_01102.mRNA.1 hypothetical protein